MSKADISLVTERTVIHSYRSWSEQQSDLEPHQIYVGSKLILFRMWRSHRTLIFFGFRGTLRKVYMRKIVPISFQLVAYACKIVIFRTIRLIYPWKIHALTFPLNIMLYWFSNVVERTCNYLAQKKNRFRSFNKQRRQKTHRKKWQFADLISWIMEKLTERK